MNLTDEQLNVALCEWRGWKKREGWVSRFDHPDKGQVSKLPSHITGIEALGNMHEAEKELPPHRDYGRYYTVLCEVVTGEKKETCDAVLLNAYEAGRIVEATARHRAIALLRVVKPEMFL